MKPGTNGAIHFHVWRGVLASTTGEITAKHRSLRSFRSRSQANQWLRAPGRRGPHSEVQRCFDEGCRARPFEASEQDTGRATERLTQEFVNQVTRVNTYSDGGNLSLVVWVRKSGELTRTWWVKASLLGNQRHINLGAAADLPLEAARALAAEIMSEFVERRRRLKEGDDNDETMRDFLARMKQLAEDAVEVKDNGADTKTVAVAEVVFREDLYPRIEHDPHLIETYRQNLEVMPPIEVNQHNELIDGFHRWTAYRLEGLVTLEAVVTETDSDADLLWLACERNAHHGYQLTSKDKERMALKLYMVTPYGDERTRLKKRGPAPHPLSGALHGA